MWTNLRKRTAAPGITQFAAKERGRINSLCSINSGHNEKINMQKS